MNFSKFFIERPIFATVLALLIVLGGAVCMFLLPVAQFPNITPPTVQVSAAYPGANASTIAQTVGIPIEQQVNGVDNMIYMSSTSSSSGTYSLTVTFEVGTDIDMATVMVQNRVNVALNSLPSVVTQQGVTVQKQSSNIVMFITLTGDSLYNQLYLANYAQLQLADQLSRVPGVGSVNVMGAGNYSMRVWLNPETMRIREITPQQVYQAISQQNMQVSAGYVGQTLSPRADNAYQYTLNVQGRLASPEEFGDIIVKVEGDKILRLRDIATITLGSESYAVSSRLEGEPAAAVAIYQLPGSNSLDVARGVNNRMQELAKSFPPGVKYHVTLDTTHVVRSSIEEVLRTFLEATLLVILVIFLFLQNWRATIIPCITIPVSLIGTLAVMELLGFSINTLSLFGLILAIAIVVDDAIVVTENAMRLLDTGRYTTRQATEQAMKEITGPIVGVVLVLLAVFIPTTMIGGIVGQLYKQFALTIAASTVISGFNSLTLTPALCAIFLRPTPVKQAGFFMLFNKGYGKIQQAYDWVVKWLLRKPWIAAGSFIILSLLAFWLFSKWPSTFMPEEDDGYFIVSLQLPPAASLERTEKAAAQAGAILSRYPEIETYMHISGFSIMSGGQQTNAATFFVILKDWKERRGKAHSAQAVCNRFNGEAYAAIEEAQAYALVPSPIPGLGNTGGLELELEDRKSLGTAELQKAVQILIDAAGEEPSIASISSTYQANVPQYYLAIDRDKVQMMGVDMNNVFSSLSYYLGAVYVNDFVLFGRTWEVKLAAGEMSQKVIDDVLRLSVANSNGEMVPFSSFMEPKETLGMNQISRYNMYNAASLTCNVADGSSSGETLKAMGQLIEKQLGNEFGYEWTSVAYQEEHSGSTTIIIFILAILVAYLVLAAQYESWTSPIAAVTGVPIAILGALIGCWIMGQPVSIFTQIGLILLIALSTKNGILIVEFARDYRKDGNSIRESAYQGGHVRLRPILMTSFAFVLGIMPLLFATGAGAESRISLGTAVVFGMFINTLLATIYIPNWYEWMQRLQERFAPSSRPKQQKKGEKEIEQEV